MVWARKFRAATGLSNKLQPSDPFYVIVSGFFLKDIALVYKFLLDLHVRLFVKHLKGAFF